MKSRKPAARREAAETPGTFSDVAACFSEDEWRLLHHWQKQLYKNVMAEIHRAMSSLGPLIATSVFSLKPPDKDELCGVDLLDVELRSSIIPLSSDAAAEPEVVSKQRQCAKDARGAAESQECVGTNTGNVLKLEEEAKSASANCYGAKGDGKKSSRTAHSDIEPAASFNIKREGPLYATGHLEPERESFTRAAGFPFHDNEIEGRLRDYRFTEQETSGSFLDSGSDVTSQRAPIGIDDEGVTYAIDVDEVQTIESLSTPAGNGRMKRKRNTESVKYLDNLKLCRATARKLWANTSQGVYEEQSPTVQGGPGSDLELRVEDPVHWQMGCPPPTHSGVYPILPSVPLAGTYVHAEGTVNNDHITQGPSLESYQPSFPPESEQAAQNRVLMTNRHALKGKRRYTCNGCGKSFFELSNLIRHERIHTGERPYHCTICGKNFNQKEVLVRHQNMHTGERPYHCDVCEKTFKRKDHLLLHRKIHTKPQLLVNTYPMETV